ncbi:hypothetical protein CFS9_02250 [Flavobacterium sp. CFS9]|uniref:Uncharacterized protein n=1 Tax=Flavobacterium sp. CFS9 TaxID=3143118 RepID=A0AAT9GWI8_9FLAO
MIWKYDFFNIIFAEQYRDIEFQIIIDLKNIKQYKMNFIFNTYNTKLVDASSALEGTYMQVHHYRQYDNYRICNKAPLIGCFFLRFKVTEAQRSKG